MKLLFIDETSDSKNPDYLGVCAALIDSAKYGMIKREFHQLITDFNWNSSVEFKGSWIFSASKGCPQVPVEKRIELVKNVIAMNRSDSNARIAFRYIYATMGSQERQYLDLLRLVTDKILPTVSSKKTGKNLLAVFCDKRSDVKRSDDVRGVMEPIFEKKGFILLEDVNLVRSNLDTVGICYADIVGYLMSRIDNIQVDWSLFEGFDNEYARKNMQLRKYLTSTNIISSIKNMGVYKAIYRK